MAEKKRVLVTGAAGFIGSHMVDLLVRLGHEVVATDVRSSKYLNPGATFIPADLTNEASLKALFRGESHNPVFLVGSLFSYTASLHLLRKVNVGGALNTLRQIKEHSPDAVIVLWSSGSVYKKPTKVAADEGAPTEPGNYYEISKLEQEQEILKFARDLGLRLVIIRPAAVYGERSGQMPFVIGPGNFVESFVHVDDVVGAAWHLAENYESISKFFEGEPTGQRFLFNVCDDSSYTIEEMFRFVAKCLQEEGCPDVRFFPIHYPIWGLKPLIWWNKFCNRHFGTELKVEPDLVEYLTAPFWMSNGKLARAGYKLRWPDTKEGLRRAIRWYRDQGMI